MAFLSELNVSEVHICNLYHYFGQIGVIYVWSLERSQELGWLFDFTGSTTPSKIPRVPYPVGLNPQLDNEN